MRKIELYCAAVGAIGFAVPTNAQSSFMPDVIGQSISPRGLGQSDKCYDPSLPQKPSVIEDRQSYAEKAIRNYVALAAASADVSSGFADKKRAYWLVDGTPQPLRSGRDPWAARIARLERVGFAVANSQSNSFHAAWRAIAVDGSTLGYYDAYGHRGARGTAWLDVLQLRSPATSSAPPNIRPYCVSAGDIEEWQEAKAKRESERTAKRATKQ
jgi:hypothetical protein